MSDIAFRPEDVAAMLGIAPTDMAGATSVWQLVADARPELAPLVRVLEARQRQVDDSAGEYFDDDAPDAPTVGDCLDVEDDEDRRARRQAGRLLLQDLLTELHDRRSRDRSLAAALGACVECWGEEVLCELCAGTGRPGARPPEPAAFKFWIAPAVQALPRRLRPQASQVEGARRE